MGTSDTSCILYFFLRRSAVEQPPLFRAQGLFSQLEACRLLGFDYCLEAAREDEKEMELALLWETSYSPAAARQGAKATGVAGAKWMGKSVVSSSS